MNELKNQDISYFIAHDYYLNLYVYDLSPTFQHDMPIYFLKVIVIPETITMYIFKNVPLVFLFPVIIYYITASTK